MDRRPDDLRRRRRARGAQIPSGAGVDDRRRQPAPRRRGPVAAAPQAGPALPDRRRPPRPGGQRAGAAPRVGVASPAAAIPRGRRWRMRAGRPAARRRGGRRLGRPGPVHQPGRRGRRPRQVAEEAAVVGAQDRAGRRARTAPRIAPIPESAVPTPSPRWRRPPPTRGTTRIPPTGCGIRNGTWRAGVTGPPGAPCARSSRPSRHRGAPPARATGHGSAPAAPAAAGRDIDIDAAVEARVEVRGGVPGQPAAPPRPVGAAAPRRVGVGGRAGHRRAHRA